MVNIRHTQLMRCVFVSSNLAREPGSTLAVAGAWDHQSASASMPSVEARWTSSCLGRATTWSCDFAAWQRGLEKGGELRITATFLEVVSYFRDQHVGQALACQRLEMLVWSFQEKVSASREVLIFSYHQAMLPTVKPTLASCHFKMTTTESQVKIVADDGAAQDWPDTDVAEAGRRFSPNSFHCTHESPLGWPFESRHLSS